MLGNMTSIVIHVVNNSLSPYAVGYIILDLGTLTDQMLTKFYDWIGRYGILSFVHMTLNGLEYDIQAHWCFIGLHF